MTKESLSQQDIDFIVANTDLDQEKVVEWYSQFKKACPENKLNKEKNLPVLYWKCIFHRGCQESRYKPSPQNLDCLVDEFGSRESRHYLTLG